MNSKEFVAGDILEATHREKKKGFHPIVFISGSSEDNFIGVMITHHEDKTKNVKMKSSHFETGQKISYDNTYLVRGKFIKPEVWGPFNKIGQLTPEGLNFVNEQINGLPEETFSKYFARLFNL